MFKIVTVGTKLCYEVQGPKAQFRRRTFHEPNLIPLNNYMKSLASESVKNGYLNLERLSRSSRLAQLRISPLERL